MDEDDRRILFSMIKSKYQDKESLILAGKEEFVEKIGGDPALEQLFTAMKIEDKAATRESKPLCSVSSHASGRAAIPRQDLSCVNRESKRPSLGSFRLRPNHIVARIRFWHQSEGDGPG